MATFWERAAHSVNRVFSLLCLFVALVVSQFGFEGRTLVLLVSVPGPEVIKLFSCSTQLSMKFKMLINIEIAKINGNFMFRSQKPAIYPANKC